MNECAAVCGIGLSSLVLAEAIGAAAGAATGAVGSAILDRAGHGGYDALSGAQNGALGAAILAIPVSTAVQALVRPFSSTDSEGKVKRPWAIEAGLGAGASAAYTVTGAAILHAAGHPNGMDVYHSGRAGLVGAATFTAAGLVLGTLAYSIGLIGLWGCGRSNGEDALPMHVIPGRRTV